MGERGIVGLIEPAAEGLRRTIEVRPPTKDFFLFLVLSNVSLRNYQYLVANI
jgi:hypothetical protein